MPAWRFLLILQILNDIWVPGNKFVRFFRDYMPRNSKPKVTSTSCCWWAWLLPLLLLPTLWMEGEVGRQSEWSYDHLIHFILAEVFFLVSRVSLHAWWMRKLICGSCQTDPQGFQNSLLLKNKMRRMAFYRSRWKINWLVHNTPLNKLSQCLLCNIRQIPESQSYT